MEKIEDILSNIFLAVFIVLGIAITIYIFGQITPLFAHHPSTDYRAIAFKQNELIIAQEETIEELATVIQTTLPAYHPDYSTIDSLSLILDSLYTTQQFNQFN